MGPVSVLRGLGPLGPPSLGPVGGLLGRQLLVAALGVPRAPALLRLAQPLVLVAGTLAVVGADVGSGGPDARRDVGVRVVVIIVARIGAPELAPLLGGGDGVAEAVAADGGGDGEER